MDRLHRSTLIQLAAFGACGLQLFGCAPDTGDDVAATVTNAIIH
jgi:hypothetical protein